MRLGILLGFTLLLLTGIFSQGRNDHVIDDEGFGPPRVAEEGAGMRLIINNTEAWEAVP